MKYWKRWNPLASGRWKNAGLWVRVRQKLCPVDTGNLRNSITHMVSDSEKAAYIGTNSEYAVYVECGTGIYYPGGRQTPWVYKDAKGDWHLTHGQRAKPFIKPAVAEHGEQYKRIIEAELKGK